jgi:transglutaminase-like putative cysteine protease
MTAAVPIVVQREHEGLDANAKAVTRRTIEKMCEHIRAAVADPLVKQVAVDCKNIAERQGCDPLMTIWYWVKSHVTFTPDEELTRRLLNEADHWELLISPPVLLRMPRMEGDCDDFTMLICALAQCLGIPCRIVTIACDRKRPGEYSHVFPIAAGANRWIPLDASHGSYPGWKVPRADVTRSTEWNMQAERVADESVTL